MKDIAWRSRRALLTTCTHRSTLLPSYMSACLCVTVCTLLCMFLCLLCCITYFLLHFYNRLHLIQSYTSPTIPILNLSEVLSCIISIIVVVVISSRLLCGCRYGLMLECWRQNAVLRPSFEQIIKIIDSFLTSVSQVRLCPIA